MPLCASPAIAPAANRTAAAVPSVLVDAFHVGRDSVSVDNCRGGDVATKHLISQGYHRIGLIMANPHSVPARDRREGYEAALAEAGIPVNHGPRTIDYFSSREGRIVGSGAEYVAAGVQLFSLNTDSSVIPQETFFLQGSMSARYGADPYLMLRALPLPPAKSFDLADRVGSLEVGKDADVVLWDGDPLDPRSAVRCVYIDGDLEYDRERDGQLF